MMQFQAVAKKTIWDHISRQISQNHGRDHSEYVDPAVEREIIF